MHLERNPIVCVSVCVILISRIQSWILGHVKVVIISQEVVLQMDKEQRLSDYTCNSNSHIFLKLIYLNKCAISHDTDLPSCICSKCHATQWMLYYGKICKSQKTLQ